jgi:hypothetical protein
VQFSLNIPAGINESEESMAAGSDWILAQFDSPRAMSVGRKAVVGGGHGKTPSFLINSILNLINDDLIASKKSWFALLGYRK